MKNEKVKKNDSEDWLDFLSQARFLSSFEKSIKSETSVIAKMVMQENLIALNISSLIFMVDTLFFYSLQSSAVGLDSVNALVEHNLGTTLPINGFDVTEKTLGQLIGILKIKNIDFFSNKNLIKKLTSYNSYRTKITHKMLFKYRSMVDIKKEGEALVGMGEIILENIKELFDEISKTELLVAINYYKSIKNSK